MALPAGVPQRIQDAIGTLAGNLIAKYVNFFEPDTLFNLSHSFGYGYRRCLIATGSFACGEWQYGDDIRLVCMTEDVETTHWEYFAERVGIEWTATSSFKDAMELSSFAIARNFKGERSALSEFAALSRQNQAGCKFYLHYCYIPGTTSIRGHPSNKFDLAQMQDQLIPPYPEYTASLGVERNLNMVRDMQLLARETFNRSDSMTSVYAEEFKAAYRNLRCWTKANGVFGGKLCFLDSETLIWLIHGAYMEGWSPKASDMTDESGVRLLDQIFKTFYDALNDNSLKTEIMTPTKRLIGENLSPEAKEAIKIAIKRTTPVDPMIATMGAGCRFDQFLDEFDYFLKVDCECWDLSPTKQAEFEEHTVPDNLNKIVKFFRDNNSDVCIGGFSARIWPLPLGENNGEIVYAIGIRRRVHSSQSTINETQRLNFAIATFMSTALRYDSVAELICISVATSQDFETYHPSSSQRIERSMTQLPIEEVPPSLSPALRTTKSPTPAKFRDVSSAISRLRHDPKHLIVEYEIGYVDRFKGLIWMPLEQWGKKETEEIDFIPEHRVKVFRRSEDGVVVWDRESRLDLL